MTQPRASTLNSDLLLFEIIVLISTFLFILFNVKASLRCYNSCLIKFSSVFFNQNAVITLLVILLHLTVHKYICIGAVHACTYLHIYCQLQAIV